MDKFVAYNYKWRNIQQKLENPKLVQSSPSIPPERIAVYPVKTNVNLGPVSETYSTY